MLLEEFPIRSSGVMQAFVFNTRRDKFKDPRVRRAFNFAFDFEEMNKQIFFGQYKRIASYFEGTELAVARPAAGRGAGDPGDRARQGAAGSVHHSRTPIRSAAAPEAVRANLREGVRLLREAGYEVRDRRLVNTKTGEPMTVEFLLDRARIRSASSLFYKPALERLGIRCRVRTVDDAQYENRLRQWDYDIIIAVWGQSLSPGNEQRGYWGSQAADQSPARAIYVGIKDPAIDALIDRVIFAKNRDELVAATKALDRVLLWNHYVVPQWTYGKVRTARWDRFGRPDPLPKYGFSAFPTVWWWDAEKAAKTGTRS